MKRIFQSLTLCLLVAFAAPAFAQARRAAPEEETHLWNDVQIALPLHKQVDLLLNATLRIGRNVTHPVDERVGAVLTFNLGRYVTLSPGYTYIATQPVAGRKGYENRLLFAGAIRFPIGRFIISD